jgi:hypothetical protein
LVLAFPTRDALLEPLEPGFGLAAERRVPGVGQSGVQVTGDALCQDGL